MNLKLSDIQQQINQYKTYSSYRRHLFGWTNYMADLYKLLTAMIKVRQDQLKTAEKEKNKEEVKDNQEAAKPAAEQKEASENDSSNKMLAILDSELTGEEMSDLQKLINDPKYKDSLREGSATNNVHVTLSRFIELADKPANDAKKPPLVVIGKRAGKG